MTNVLLKRFGFLSVMLSILNACNSYPPVSENALKPLVITEPVKFDTDDPAIWIHPDDASKSLILGTDKEQGGGLYVYGLDGKIIQNKIVKGLHRPNNVDVEYGMKLGDTLVDIAVVTERNNETIRIFSLPDLQPLDKGGIEIFIGEEKRGPMGVALYKNPSDNSLYVIVGRKEGPLEGYLWQYHLSDAGDSSVAITEVRRFGKYSGKKEIEAIAVDDELGFVYYSDEMHGIRKYYADPALGNEELAFFGENDFTRDMEGISIYDSGNGKGYILVSDQQKNAFNIYPREGTKSSPHDHKRMKSIDVSAIESDGSEVTSVSMGPRFPQGLFVVMSTDKTFHYYDWRDVMVNNNSK